MPTLKRHDVLSGSHGIRPCGVTIARPLSWGAGPPLGYEAAPDRAVRRQLGGPICATAATLDLFGSAATKLAC
jgi:hypothetical protein